MACSRMQKGQAISAEVDNGSIRARPAQPQIIANRHRWLSTGFMECPEKNSRRSEERGTDDFIEVNGAAQQRNLGLCNFYSGAIVPSGVVQPALVVTELFAAGLLHRDAAIAS